MLLHSRRKFVDAIKTEQAAQDCLLHIREMYRQEALIRKENLEGEEKLAARRARCLPAAEAFWAVCYSVMQRTDLEPSHPLIKAVGYACKRRKELMVCFNNPDVPLDTNHVEKANRPVASRGSGNSTSQIGRSDPTLIRPDTRQPVESTSDTTTSLYSRHDQATVRAMTVALVSSICH